MPDTPAIRAATAAGIPYRVIEIGRVNSAEEAAAAAGVAPEALLRTIVVRLGEGDYRFVLAPAGRQFDWAPLRAQLGVRRMTLPDADEAREVTGYVRGTITPFGATTAFPVLVDETVLAASEVAIGGGAHGVLLAMTPADLVRATKATPVALR